MLLDLPAEVGAARLPGDRDRMEQEGDGFHALVADGFRCPRRGRPERWVVVDAGGTVDEVEAAVWSAVARLVDRTEPR